MRSASFQSEPVLPRTSGAVHQPVVGASMTSEKKCCLCDVITLELPSNPEYYPKYTIDRQQSDGHFPRYKRLMVAQGDDLVEALIVWGGLFCAGSLLVLFYSYRRCICIASKQWVEVEGWVESSKQFRTSNHDKTDYHFHVTTIYSYHANGKTYKGRFHVPEGVVFQQGTHIPVLHHPKYLWFSLAKEHLPDADPKLLGLGILLSSLGAAGLMVTLIRE